MTVTQVQFEIITWDGDHDSPAELNPFFQQTHGDKAPAAWVRHKMASPESSAIAALAYHNRTPAGLVIFGRIPFCLGSHKEAWAMSYQTWVSAQHRRKGLFSRLLTQAEQACRDAGVDALLNIPNGASRPGFEKAGWTPIRSAQAYLSVPLRHTLGLGRTFRDPRERIFVPTAAPTNLNDATLDAYAALDHAHGQRYNWWRSSRAPEYLASRLSPMRGPSYQLVEADAIAAIVRIGRRGNAAEAQIMATTTSPMNRRDLVRITSAIRRATKVELVSAIESLPAGRSAWLTAGYVPVPSQIRPYYKVLNPQSQADHQIEIAGIDVHTW